jgi:hypothetical protein
MVRSAGAGKLKSKLGQRRLHPAPLQHQNQHRLGVKKIGAVKRDTGGENSLSMRGSEVRIG